MAELVLDGWRRLVRSYAFATEPCERSHEVSLRAILIHAGARAAPTPRVLHTCAHLDSAMRHHAVATRSIQLHCCDLPRKCKSDNDSGLLWCWWPVFLRSRVGYWNWLVGSTMPTSTVMIGVLIENANKWSQWLEPKRKRKVVTMFLFWCAVSLLNRHCIANRYRYSFVGLVLDSLCCRMRVFQITKKIQIVVQ